MNIEGGGVVEGERGRGVMKKGCGEEREVD